jgi:predicted ATPase
MELLERDTAVEALEGALAQARAGAGRMVLVAGEAGVSKTPLTERVARAAGADARFLWGRATRC